MFLIERAVAALLDSIPRLMMLCINVQLITHPVQGFVHFLKILLFHEQNRTAYVYMLMTSLFKVK